MKIHRAEDWVPRNLTREAIYLAINDLNMETCNLYAEIKREEKTLRLKKQALRELDNIRGTLYALR